MARNVISHLPKDIFVPLMHYSLRLPGHHCHIMALCVHFSQRLSAGGTLEARRLLKMFLWA
jgi:hypothetical protein